MLTTFSLLRPRSVPEVEVKLFLFCNRLQTNFTTDGLMGGLLRTVARIGFRAGWSYPAFIANCEKAWKESSAIHYDVSS